MNSQRSYHVGYAANWLWLLARGCGFSLQDIGAELRLGHGEGREGRLGGSLSDRRCGPAVQLAGKSGN